jgi:hypothetical protein
MAKSEAADVPDSYKNAARTRLLKKRSKRKATRKVQKTQLTKSITKAK